ncbi:MAG: tetratricopeptide repeat protein [Bacteroidota bacterium]
MTVKNRPEEYSATGEENYQMPLSNPVISRSAVIFCLFLIAIHLAAYFFFTDLSWGINYFYFLPPYLLILYCVAGILAIIWSLNGSPTRLLKPILEFWKNKPVLFGSAMIAMFICAAWFLRVRVPLLGDSYVIVNNIQNSLNGVHDLQTYREPLSVYYFYWCVKLLGAGNYYAILQGFLVGELILGTIYIIVSAMIARCILREQTHQLLLFVFLITLPSMQIFFGYIEIYAVVLVCVSLFILASIYYLIHGTHFYLIYPAFALMVSAHFLSVILIPAFLYLTIIEYRAHGIKNIFYSLLVVAIAGTGLFMYLGGNISRFLLQGEHAHYLSIFSRGDSYQAYSLFSVFHLTELCNLVFLETPVGIFIVLMAWKLLSKKPLMNSPLIFLIICSVPFVLFLLTAKFDLGMAKDWDVSAPLFFILNLTLAVFVFTQPDLILVNDFILLLVVAVLGATPWFILNAMEEPSVQRTVSLLDDRILSQDGYFQTTFHLSSAALYLDDTTSYIRTWEKFTAKYPGVGKGWKNLAHACQIKDKVDSKIFYAFDRWLEVETGNKDARHEYAQYCSELGNAFFQNKDYHNAELYYFKSISIDTTYIVVYNNLGYFYSQIGFPAKAESLFLNAIHRFPDYEDTYLNLGNLYNGQGKYPEAVGIYNRAIARNPKCVGAFEGLANLYFKLKDRENTIAALQQAARLGSRSAQQTLMKDNGKW